MILFIFKRKVNKIFLSNFHLLNCSSTSQNYARMHNSELTVGSSHVSLTCKNFEIMMPHDQNDGSEYFEIKFQYRE